MRINNTSYTRGDLLQRIGNISQLGGTRHCVLSDGRARGVSAVEFDTGAGLQFTVLPDRGLDISAASYKGVNLVYKTPNGEVHPAFYEPQGFGWLRTFFGGLLTTCGLTHLGPPSRDDEGELGLHGRYTTSPAAQVCDTSGWKGDEYNMRLTGVVEECALFGDKIRLTRTISSRIGSKSLVISDVAENFGYRTSPFTILYHINPGFPLLDDGARLHLTVGETSPCDEKSAGCMSDMLSFSAPMPGFVEENFHHTMLADGDGRAHALFVNRSLGGGLGLHIQFDTSTLPYLNEWKMMGQGDYVVGVEPCNAPCENRVVLRERGLLRYLEPGEVRRMNVEISIADGQDEIDSLLKRISEVSG